KSTLNNSTNLLENDEKFVFSNDAAGRDTLSTEYKWNSSTAAWDLYGKTVITYSPNDAPTSVTSYQWNSSKLLWEGVFKAVYSFDVGYMTSFIIYMWDDNSSTWVGYSKSDYLYNTNGNKTVETTYLWTGSVWAKQSVSNYYYSPSKFTGQNEIVGGSDMTIYPNPVIDFLYINNLAKYAMVSIVSIDGRIIINNRQLVEDAIDVTKLKTGIYFLMINTSDGKYTYKFVKR
ncbi:MAG TPA: T9SS type A sorting domain-containing protein, partial [Paludibacter sp.]|nr:T9SS type A sorting domain-containing protein [Paludibacter sp.]